MDPNDSFQQPDMHNEHNSNFVTDQTYRPSSYWAWQCFRLDIGKTLNHGTWNS